MDAADAIALWGDELKVEGTEMLHTWSEQRQPPPEPPPPSPLSPGDRITVYWTELREWFTCTFMRSQLEDADGGGKQRSSKVVYDATGPWATCSVKQLTYWHCLDDEQWSFADDNSQE